MASASGHAASANCAPKRCYQILTHNDRADLKPGQYLLESPKPQPAFAREISKETRAFVLDRNGFTCQMCGAVAGEAHPYDPTRKTRLHIGHVIDKSMGGSDEPANLRAICSVCNEGASNVMLPRPDLQRLLVQSEGPPLLTSAHCWRGCKPSSRPDHWPVRMPTPTSADAVHQAWHL